MRRTVAGSTTSSELKRIEAELRLEAGEATLAADDLNVASLCRVWCEGSSKRWTDKTSYDNSRLIEKHIGPSNLGQMQVSRVRTMHVQKFQDELLTRLSPSRVRSVRAVLSGAFKWAAASGIIGQNPTASTLPLPTRQSSVRATDPADWARAIKTAASGRAGLSTLVQFLGVTGCRLSEALAVSWSDIADSEVVISKAISSTPGVGLVVKQTKTGRARRAPLGSALAEVLAADRQSQIETCIATEGITFAESGFVWSLDGCGVLPWRPDTASKWVKQTGVAALELRHMAATQMLGNGTPVHTVASILGHSSTKMTLDVYGEAIPANHDAAAEIMERLSQTRPQP